MARKTIKLLFSICMVLLITGLVVFTAHSEAADTKPVVLRAISYQPMSDNDLTMIGFRIFQNLVNERSDGQLKINLIGSRESIPASEQMEACSTGVVDIVHTASYHKNLVPEARAIEQSPFTPWVEREIGFFDILVKATKDKLGVVPLGRTAYGIPFFVYTNVKVEKIEDFRGLKFRSNVSYKPLFEKLGIVRVDMPSSEIYTAMERGLVVGFSNPKLISRASLQEVTKYRVDHGFWGVTSYNYINQNVFAKLPDHLQKLLQDVSIQVEKELTPYVEKFNKDEDKRQLDGGMEFIKLTPPDDAKFVEMAYGTNWAQLFKELPEKGPMLKKLLTPK